MLLADLTTMRVGGPARTLVTASTRDELVAAALDAWSSGEDWLVLGGGSNVVIADEGFDGTVIHVTSRGIERDGTTLRVQAGEPWDALVEFAVAERLAGLEALSGIPGCSGAAPIQNIGAYGQELGDTLVSIEFLDYLSGEVERVTAAELGLGYRTSALKQGRQGVVLSLELQLRDSGVSLVTYPQLARELGVPVESEATLPDIRSTVLRLRASKGMLLDATDPDTTSCGSFFTNPIVSENFARALPAELPQWLVDDLYVKLSAAWLIEQAGVSKGFSLPGSRAAISSKHSLAITNRGGATAEEVAELARYIRARVAGAFGVELQPEPIAVGVQL